MRLSGFASGMDINQMVKDLMKAERQPMQKMEQDQKELILKMGEYREVNREFLEFRNNTFDTIMRRANMDAKQVSSSNEALVSGTASAGASNGTYTISNVSQLATAEYHSSSQGIINSDGAQVDPNASLLDQFGKNSVGFSITTYDKAGAAVTNSFSFDGADTLNGVLSEINNSELGVQAFFDEHSGKISMSRTEVGVYNEGGNEIEFTGAFLTDTLHMTGTPDNTAQNAVFTMNGLTTERQSNDFDINGLNISLKSETTESVSLTVSNNTDDIFDTVMGFVDDYNKLIEMVGGKVSQEYHRDYAPLTDEQRGDMSDSEIEMWEERAHSGLVRNDRILSGALTQMRQDIYAPVNGDANLAFSQIAELGITTTSNYQDRGRLEVDETKLRAAIDQDPEAVFQMFAADGETHEEKGIARRVRETLNDQMQVISRRAGGSDAASNQSFTMGREIDQASDRITNFERRMQQVEDRYWSQFTAMEQAMAQANAQAEQLMSFTGGGQMM
ncbi:flagellar capping protein [Salipaludibacillus neizhouensis]|uniref:Flagellar hook-associated protein 2 n=1 Tax=Salipaludibacillus neizhouensis TaxID=885475 RepID=A0A3A9KCW5_9BACI|nr:flagellar hook-associated protein 2 [Salipaludibacillus neizhouensis]RKL68372.1 flagellar capping protein [Salipaludibacillus neizhouensis]